MTSELSKTWSLGVRKEVKLTLTCNEYTFYLLRDGVLALLDRVSSSEVRRPYTYRKDQLEELLEVFKG